MGLIHIYCGDGKGKTTAAVGLALRGAGHGMRVHFIQFLKNGESGEISVLKKINGISVAYCDRNYGFFSSMTEKDKGDITECHNRMLGESIKLAEKGLTDMLILDEFNAAYNYGLLDKKAAEDFIFNKPEHIELVLTGRNPDSKFIEISDYVSVISAEKHPFEKGIAARKGVEY